MDVHMPGKGGVVRQDRVISDLAIVCDVNVRHYPVVIAHTGHAAILNRPAIDRTIFPYGVVVADLEAGNFPGIFLVLRIVADGGKLEDSISRANGSRAFDDHV
jgi:hypothetical protein